MTKKLTLLFTLMLMGVLNSNLWAQASQFAGQIIKVGDPVTTLQTDTWYVLQCASEGVFALEGDANALNCSAETPHNTGAEDNCGYLVKLESQEDGRYLLKTGKGNYILNMITGRNKGTAAEATDLAPYTITSLGGTEFSLVTTLKNGLKPAMSASATAITGKIGTPESNSSTAWTFNAVTLVEGSALSGKDYVEFILAKGGLVRVTNRRSNNYNLIDNGTKTTTAVKNDSDMSQVWILTKSGDGYTLRNGTTGRYLDDNGDFQSPNSSATKLYVQYSPNNTSTTTSWVNFAEDAAFSGKSAMNMNDGDKQLYKWYASGDAGSDWIISEVTNFTEEEIIENMKQNSKYRKVEDGKIYRINNIGKGRVIFENLAGNNLSCQSSDPTKLAQCWRTIVSGSKVMFQNVLTERYVRLQGGALSQSYTTTTTKAVTQNGFSMKQVGDDTCPTFYIEDISRIGLHCDAGNAVVGWWNANANNEWGFEIVEISDEEIAAGRQSFLDYQALSSDIESIQANMDALFKDAACTELKDEIKGLTDGELAANANYAALNDDLKAVVLKIKNNTWKTFTNTSTNYTRDFEKFFRVADYKVYSDHQKMSRREYTYMSNQYGRLSNPTGITGYGGDLIYVFVDGEVSDDCTLALEMVTGPNSTGAQKTLKKGLNVFLLGDQANLFIFYELHDPEKYLADYPDIKVHIEGGRLNGYWDATRGMNNADWKLLQQSLLKESPVLNLKTEYLVFCVDNETVKQTEPDNMEGLMRVWNTLLWNEERFMGLEEFEGRRRNVWSVCHNSDYMHASGYGTYYNKSTAWNIMNYNNMTRATSWGGECNLWGPSHEMGHNHQLTINMVGTGESSNNMFSNINQFSSGVIVSRHDGPVQFCNDFNEGKFWLDRSIMITTRMFFQLYLYFHELGNDTTFLPRLFKELRKRPINRWGNGWNNSITDGNGHTGGYDVKGSQDYLHFAKVVCDVAQADMSEFFEAYGMFIPVKSKYRDDYGAYFHTTTQAEIDEAKAYMQKYPRKLGNIMFIDDQLLASQKANTDNIFGAQPMASGLKRGGGGAGDTGMYFDYKEGYQNDGYYYTQNILNKKITVYGTGAVGYKVYNEEGKLVFISNKNEFTLPSDLTNYVIKAAEGNGNDVIVPKGRNNLALDVTYPGQEETRTIYTAGTIEPLPTNALAVVRADQTTATPDELKAYANVVDETGHASSLVIDGNAAWSNPVNIQADQVSFTKSATGYAALKLPFAVNNTAVEGLQTVHYSNGTLTLVNATEVEAGMPVVVQGNAAITVSNATVAAGNFAEESNINVLSEDGQSVVMVETASPFLFNIADGTFINQINADETLQGDAPYVDLMGRVLPGTPSRKGVYIKNGKKYLIK